MSKAIKILQACEIFSNLIRSNISKEQLKNKIVIASIPLPIRDLKIFLKNYPDKIKKALNKLKLNLTLPTGYEEDVLKEYLRNIFSYMRNPSDFERIIDLINAADRKTNELKSLFDYAMSSKGHDLRGAIGMIIDRLDYFLEDLIRLKKIIDADIKEDERSDSRYEYYLEYPDEDIDNGNFYRGVKEIPFIIDQLVNETNYYIDLLKEKLREMVAPIVSGKENNPPESLDEETLYHASINADKIFDSGFHRSEVKTEGIGGSTETATGKQGISFTADLYIAKEVARCLKEAIMIANKEIDGHDILEWSDNPEELISDIKSYYGSEIDLSDPIVAFQLYRSYLGKSNRYDPLFYGSPESMIDNFKGKDSSSVGIIAAKINMRHPDISYHGGMLEYRLPVDAIISIDKLIK